MVRPKRRILHEPLKCFYSPDSLTRGVFSFIMGYLSDNVSDKPLYREDDEAELLKAINAALKTFGINAKVVTDDKEEGQGKGHDTT